MQPEKGHRGNGVRDKVVGRTLRRGRLFSWKPEGVWGTGCGRWGGECNVFWGVRKQVQRASVGAGEANPEPVAASAALGGQPLSLHWLLRPPQAPAVTRDYGPPQTPFLIIQQNLPLDLQDASRMEPPTHFHRYCCALGCPLRPARSVARPALPTSLVSLQPTQQSSRTITPLLKTLPAHAQSTSESEDSLES